MADQPFPKGSLDSATNTQTDLFDISPNTSIILDNFSSGSAKIAILEHDGQQTDVPGLVYTSEQAFQVNFGTTRRGRIICTAGSLDYSIFPGDTR